MACGLWIYICGYGKPFHNCNGSRTFFLPASECFFWLIQTCIYVLLLLHVIHAIIWLMDTLGPISNLDAHCIRAVLLFHISRTFFPRFDCNFGREQNCGILLWTILGTEAWFSPRRKCICGSSWASHTPSFQNESLSWWVCVGSRSIVSSFAQFSPINFELQMHKEPPLSSSHLSHE